MGPPISTTGVCPTKPKTPFDARLFKSGVLLEEVAEQLYLTMAGIRPEPGRYLNLARSSESNRLLVEGTEALLAI
jgi:hypothetical protein